MAKNSPLKKIDITKSLVIDLMPVRASNSYKGDYGRALLIGGNQNMGGAIQMAAVACVNSGCGLTTVATEAVNLVALHSQLPEAMVVNWRDSANLSQAIEKAEIILMGPGMGRHPGQWQHMLTLLAQRQAAAILILDGDAITMFAEDMPTYLEQLSAYHIIMTPHLGEWRRLCANKIGSEEKSAVQNWVDQHEIHLVLKGERTEIYLPGQDYYYQNTTGNPGMAIGGSGDTLAGMISGMMGQTTTIEAGLIIAVFLHSYIGDEIFAGNYVVLPSQIAHRIPPTMKQFVEAKSPN